MKYILTEFVAWLLKRWIIACCRRLLTKYHLTAHIIKICKLITTRSICRGITYNKLQQLVVNINCSFKYILEVDEYFQIFICNFLFFIFFKCGTYLDQIRCMEVLTRDHVEWQSKGVLDECLGRHLTQIGAHSYAIALLQKPELKLNFTYNI